MSGGLIITAVGQDRPGIVDRVSGAIYQEGCNLEDSRMAILGGEFALMLLAVGPREQLDAVRARVQKIGEELGLSTLFRTTEAAPKRAELAGRLPFRISAVSLDQPGIVHRITHLLATHGVNVADLETRLTHAPITGAPMFSLELDVHVPADLPLAKLRLALKSLAEAENIDLEIKAER